MTYTVTYSFSSRLAQDTPKGTAVSNKPPYSINVTATVTDSNNNIQVAGKKLQLYTSPETLIVMNDAGISLNKDNEYQSYLIPDDGTGAYSFWLAADNKTIVSTSFAVQDDADSEIDGPIVVFSSYQGLTTKFGPPLLPVDENDIIQLSDTEPYIIVNLPSSTSAFLGYDQTMATLLINGNQCVVEPFTQAYDNGFKVPTNMLVPETLNRFGYTIQNGNQPTSPIAPQVRVNGAIMTRPAPSLLRTLTESPYLPNHAQGIIDASKDIIVSIDCPPANPDNLAEGDTIYVTVYVNAWIQASNIPNNTIFTLEEISVRTLDIGKPLTTIIPAGKLAGFGMNASGIPGSLYIDYTLTKSGETQVSAQPMYYFSGYINTVGPI